MEGNVVGKQNSKTVDFELPTPDVLEAVNNELNNQPNESQLLWPTNLMKRLNALQNRFNWPVALGIVSFILSSLICIALGPAQLIIMLITKDYTLVNEQYFPTALRVSLLLSGLIALLNVVIVAFAWFGKLRSSWTSAALSGSSVILIALVWTIGFLVSMQPNQLAAIMTITVALLCGLVFLSTKQKKATAKPSIALRVCLATIAVCSIAEVIFTGLFIAEQERNQAILAEKIRSLAISQEDALVEGVPRQLSDLATTLCDNKAYQVVYLANNSDDPSGLFECYETHDVYSVVDNDDPNDKTVTGLATYLGTTYNPVLEEFLPDAPYLYRTFNNPDLPNDLVMLLTAESEETLVEWYAEPLSQIFSALPRQTMNVNIFYNDNLNTVLSTRDFVLLGTVGTMANVDALPHGNNYRTHHNGELANFIFRPDTYFAASNELGSTPELYSYQTLNAIKSHRRLSFQITPETDLSPDALRALLYASLIDPLQN